jgi:hypothetical protein
MAAEHRPHPIALSAQQGTKISTVQRSWSSERVSCLLIDLDARIVRVPHIEGLLRDALMTRV